MKKQYKSIFISDLHIGSKHCKSSLLSTFLKHNECETLYLVGDIIDGWKLKTGCNIPKDQVKLIQQLLKRIKKGTNVRYVVGNHDEFIRPFLKFNISIENLEIYNEFIHEGINGKKYLVTHGDLFDRITKAAKWLCYLGDGAYTVALNINTLFNHLRAFFGMPYWSLSKYLKHNVKNAVSFIFEYEHALASYCKKRKYDGVICGHIHTAEMKIIDEVEYMNTGDWVESCTAIVETYDGEFHLIHWKGDINGVDSIINSDAHKQPE